MRQDGWALAFVLLAGMPVAMPALAQAPPPAGWTIGLGFGAGWNSNPREISTRAKGDSAFSPDISLSYRQALWEGGALTLGVFGGSELYGRETSAGFQRLLGTAALSQTWQATTATVNIVQRKALSHDFSRHDSASTEIGVNLSRIVTLDESWSLLVFGRLARRLVGDGTEDRWRANANVTLTYKSGAWSWRAGGGFAYALEDKTPILPRINDRSLSARLGIAYEWDKDREIALGGSFNRTYSSYQPNRYKSFSLQPRVSATIRF